jgi:hypothetical protein
MGTASFVIGCVAFVLSAFSVAWQVFTWQHERRFDVRVRVGSEMHRLGCGEYIVNVVVENHGETTEALQEMSLLTGHDDIGEDSSYFQSGSTWDRGATGELPPRRNLRFTYDLLASRYTAFPDEVVAVATLESGEVVRSEPYRTDAQSFEVVMAGRLRPKAADDWLAAEEARRAGEPPGDDG